MVSGFATSSSLTAATHTVNCDVSSGADFTSIQAAVSKVSNNMVDDGQGAMYLHEMDFAKLRKLTVTNNKAPMAVLVGSGSTCQVDP